MRPTPRPKPRRDDPLIAVTTPNKALPTATYTYTARVNDNAGNPGTNTGSVAFALGYFNCDWCRRGGG